MKLLKNKEKIFYRCTLILISLIFAPFSSSATYTISGNSDSVGQTFYYKAKGGESLFDIAHHFDVGMGEMVRNNPRLAHRRIRAGTSVLIPAAHKLPSGPREGIVLNVAQLRVYYFHPDGVTVSTYPVGVGRQGWSTPLGHTSIVRKVKNPTWTPTASIRREAERRGRRLPHSIGPGPKNPLGQYAMRLGFKSILMHGTNAPRTVGLRSSHGCIRMYPKDIKELFSLVPAGTSVRIVSESIK